MATLLLTIDDGLRERLAAMAARGRKPLPEWAAEQLDRLAGHADAESPAGYSAAWMAAFGSIPDRSFEAPARPFPPAVETLDAE